jgi:glycine hydroxymethyltransferase
VQYGVRAEDGRIDFDEVERQAEMHRPKLIICGGSAYPRIIDFARFRAIAEAIAKKVDSAMFPGLQGGPLMHVIAAKAVAFGEALHPSFARYARAVVDNAKALAETLAQEGLAIVSGGTDTHLMLVDLRPLDLAGRDAEKALERAGMTCNKNGIPFDPRPPTVTSGIRLGSPAATTRGFGVEEFRQIGRWIGEVLRGLARHANDNEATEKRVRQAVSALCERFPVYPQG